MQGKELWAFDRESYLDWGRLAEEGRSPHHWRALESTGLRGSRDLDVENSKATVQTWGTQVGRSSGTAQMEDKGWGRGGKKGG